MHTASSAGKGAGKHACSQAAGGDYIIGSTFWKNILVICVRSLKKMCASFDPAIQFLGISLKVINIHTKCSDKHIHPSISYDKGERGKQSKHPTVGEKLNKDGIFIRFY